jgi:hypothetical protein
MKPAFPRQRTANEENSSNKGEPRRTRKDEPNGDDRNDRPAMSKEQSSGKSTKPNVVRVTLKTHPPKLPGQTETSKDLHAKTQERKRTKPEAWRSRRFLAGAARSVSTARNRREGQAARTNGIVVSITTRVDVHEWA